MDIAHRVAELSHCQRKQVGAIAVKDNRIISMGWNGTPTGWCNECEDEDGKTKIEVYHAESNLISKLAKSNESGEGASIYLTCSPCINCAKLLAQAGVVNVYYGEDYDGSNPKGHEFLNKCNINIQKI